jgi:hypothetical protein
MFSRGSEGASPVTARRAKRENGGLGEDPLGSTMTYLQALRSGRLGPRPSRARFARPSYEPSWPVVWSSPLKDIYDDYIYYCSLSLK